MEENINYYDNTYYGLCNLNKTIINTRFFIQI